MDVVHQEGSGWGLGNLTILMVTATLILVVNFLLSRYKQDKILKLIPGPRPNMLLGNALFFNVNPELLIGRVGELCTQYYKEGICRVWIGHRRFVLLFKPEGVETILSSNKHIDKSHEYNYLHQWLGTGLLTSTGRKWHSRRKALTPAFHFKILEDFMEVFNEQSTKLVTKLSNKCGGQSFDIFPYITHCALDIIHETALGGSINAQDHSDSAYVKAVYEIGRLVQLRQLRPWYQPYLLYKLSGLADEELRCLKILHGEAYAAINERKKHLSQFQKEAEQTDDIGRKKKMAFIDLLLSCTIDNKPLPLEDIREEVDTFMFEGHDTTASAITFCTYLLGCSPDKQKILHEELDSVFGDSDRPATSDDLKQLKYLECCVKEALRLYPSVPMLARNLTEDVNIEGYLVPKNTTTLILPYYLHRNAEQFPDPEVFKPERFELSSVQSRHAYSYVPFSAGPRNCIGQKFALMEEKTVLSTIFRKYRVESMLQNYSSLPLVGELILRPHQRVDVKLFSRN